MPKPVPDLRQLPIQITLVTPHLDVKAHLIPNQIVVGYIQELLRAVVECVEHACP